MPYSPTPSREETEREKRKGREEEEWKKRAGQRKTRRGRVKCRARAKFSESRFWDKVTEQVLLFLEISRFP